jgi:hypothetical protein
VPAVAEKLGLRASVANVDLGLLAGHLTVEGLRVAPLAAPADQPDLLDLGRAFVNLEWLSLLRGELEIAELTLDQPVLGLVRAPDGTIALPAPPPSAEPEPPPASDAEKSEPLPVTVKSLAIRNTEFHLVDGAGGPHLIDFALAELGFSDLRLVGAKVGLGGIRISEPRLRVRREVQTTRAAARAGPPPAATPAGPPPEVRIDDLEIERAEFSVLTDAEPVSVALRLKTTGLSLAPDAPFPLELGLEAGRGSFALAGKLGLNPLVWDGRVTWQGLELPLFVRAAQPELSPWLHSCTTTGDLAVKLLPAGLHVSGRVGVDELAFEDPEQELALGWKSLAIELRSADVPRAGSAEPVRVAIAKIALDTPQARYVLPNTAVERLVTSRADAGAQAPPEPAAPAAEPASQAPPPILVIDAIEVRRGGADFTDRSAPEPYRGAMTDLSLDAEGIALPERTVQKLRVRGVAPVRAPFELRGALPGARGSLTFKLTGLPLAQFSSYASRAADLRIPKGELTLDAKATLTNAGASGKVDSKVVVHQLSIQGGPNAISVAGMPLDLALALLRDPGGDIALPLPIQYGEKGAGAGVGAILLGALRAAITGAVTSPIKALGMIVPEGGTGEVSFAPVAFAPGSSSPPADAAEKLAPLAALLEQRPGLGLALVGRAGPGDRLALAEQILVERVAADEDLPSLKDAGFFARRRIASALADRGRGRPGALEPEDDALLHRYLEATPVSAQRYADLAQRRAAAVRDLLAQAHVLSPDRLTVETAADAPSDVVPELRAGGGA